MLGIDRVSVRGFPPGGPIGVIAFNQEDREVYQNATNLIRLIFRQQDEFHRGMLRRHPPVAKAKMEALNMTKENDHLSHCSLVVAHRWTAAASRV